MAFTGPVDQIRSTLQPGRRSTKPLASLLRCSLLLEGVPGLPAAPGSTKRAARSQHPWAHGEVAPVRL